MSLQTLHIVFWQNMPSQHQSAQIRALARRAGVQVTLLTEDSIPHWRQKMGWSLPDFGNARVLIKATPSQIKHVIEQSTNESTVHIFSGLSAHPLLKKGFERCANTSALVGIQSEPGKWYGPKGKLRVTRSKLQRLRYEQNLDFVLAIGHLADRWFEMSGYQPKKVYRYGYFVEAATAENSSIQKLSQKEQQMPRLIFIGRQVPTKGIIVLLNALKGLMECPWHLDIVGDGECLSAYTAWTKVLGLQERVKFYGALPHFDAMARLEQSDLLILPSRWDGWGAVVNEALHQGVPVICSDHCGAADLIANSFRGEVFQAESVTSLRQVLQNWLPQLPLAPERRTAIREWSSNISGEAAADYLLHIIRHVQQSRSGAAPTPPWLDISAS